MLAAIVLIVLNPFAGAVTIGVITLAVIALLTLISVLIVGAVWKGMNKRHNEVWNRLGL